MSTSLRDKLLQTTDPELDDVELFGEQYIDPNGFGQEPSIEGPFFMVIETVSIDQSDVLVTGRIKRGTIKAGDELELVGIDYNNIPCTCKGILVKNQMVGEGAAGDAVSIFLDERVKFLVHQNQVLAKPDTCQANAKFSSAMYVLAENEGGRKTSIFNNYKPQIQFRDSDHSIKGVIELPEAIELLAPGGSSLGVQIRLVNPVVLNIGLRFSVNEGGRRIAVGIVTSISE